MRLTIALPPRSKQRPRYSNGVTYTPKETREYEEQVRIIARGANIQPLEGAIRVKVWFYMPIPKSWPEAKKQAAEAGQIRPASKPDIDNLAKAILDALNGGIAYSDDKQIVELTLMEFYGERPRTVVEMEKCRNDH